MIEVDNISKVYGSTVALQNVSFQVAPGEILGFLGPNGAGKTTTMRILTGYLTASRGTARIAGYDIHEDSMAVRQLIGYLPETPPLYPEMTVTGFLDFVARIKQVPAGDRAQKVKLAMERCGLSEKRNVLIRKLSKGFRQRVGIAQALVHDPPVIILDEPTVGLDPRQIIEVRNLIKSLAGQHTMILSTHILPEVSMTCSQVAIINRGQVVTTGSLENLMEQLSQNTGYEIELAGDVHRIESDLMVALQNIPGVSALDKLEVITVPGSEPRYRLRVVCQGEAEPGQEIAATILENGIGLYELRRTRASLEEIFLEATTSNVITEESVDTTWGNSTESPEATDSQTNQTEESSGA